MPLTIQTIITPPGDAILDDPAAIVALAVAHGDLTPGGGTPIAITLPKIGDDQTGLAFELRANNTEFRFTGGTLKLTLRQEVHISNALSPCARTVWLQHENKHVQDNERVMARMDHELRADAVFAFILIRPTWQKFSVMGRPKDVIRERIQEVFTRLTSTAASRQDTATEYKSVEKQIKLRCGHTIGPKLQQGTYGQGVDMIQLSLNNHPPTLLPLLKVDGVFGARTDARVREFQRNNGLTPDGVVGKDTRAALGL